MLDRHGYLATEQRPNFINVLSIQGSDTAGISPPKRISTPRGYQPS